MESGKLKVVLSLKDSLFCRRFENFQGEIHSRVALVDSSASKEQIEAALRSLSTPKNTQELIVSLFQEVTKQKVQEETILQWPKAVLSPLFFLEEFCLHKDIDSILKAFPFKVQLCYKTKSPLKQSLIGEMVREHLPSFHKDFRFGSSDELDAEIYIGANIPKRFQHELHKVIFVSNMNVKKERKMKHFNGVLQGDIPFSIVSLCQLPSKIQTMFSKEQKAERLRVGYSFAPKKMRWMFDKGLLFDDSDAVYHPIDFRLETQPKVDVIIHKYTIDDSALMEQVAEMEKAFAEYYLNRHDKKTGPRVVDPIDHFGTFMDRRLLTKFFMEMEKSEELNGKIQEICRMQGFPPLKISTPKSLEVESKAVGPHNIKEVIEANGLRYPLFFKTNDAAASNDSHMMGLVMDPTGAIAMEENPIFRKHDHIIQEAIDHDEVVFKLYVIGEHLFTNKRESMPNLADMNFQTPFFFFHSQVKFRSLLQGKPCFSPEKVNLNGEIMKAITKHIRKEIGLTLFGLDVLRESKTGTYQLIDINYFPGFKEIPKSEFKALLLSVFRGTEL